MTTQMTAASRSNRQEGNSASPTFSEAEHMHCLSQITPIAIGLSKITAVLNGTQALASYSGGRVRRRFQPPSADDQKVSYRRHHLRRLEYKGGTINSRVGLGRGWEKFNQGVPIDSPRRKFKV